MFHKLHIQHYDIVTAFLNEMLKKSLYMKYFIKYEVENHVLKLLKVLYSLKQTLCV